MMLRDTHTPFACDFYHLTMAQAMFDDGSHNKEEVYEMYIRNVPFKGGYLLTAGLAPALESLQEWAFKNEDIEFLKAQIGNDGNRLFSDGFLEMLKNTELDITIDALPEGELAFPNEPIMRVKGPSYQCQLVETLILNSMNAACLIATKSARIHEAATHDGVDRTVMEFGMRRAQAEFGMMPTRSAVVGGASSTSNVYAAQKFGIKAAGTMAHCFIMREEDEKEAFKKYLSSFPGNSTLLIDTYDTIEGAKNAIEASLEMGVFLSAVRLDSGDLAYLSKEVRKLLDEAGLEKTKIVASNDLDEYKIVDLLVNQKAPIDVFGIGTMLVTAYDQPALGGVYKVKEVEGVPVIKVSENAIKTTIPGATNVVRILDAQGNFNGDVIVKNSDDFLVNGVLVQDIVSVNPENQQPKLFRKGAMAYNPLQRVMTDGKVSQEHLHRDIYDIQEFALANLEKLDESHRRFSNAHKYVAGIERSLYEQREDMRLEALNKKAQVYNGEKFNPFRNSREVRV